MELIGDKKMAENIGDIITISYFNLYLDPYKEGNQFNWNFEDLENKIRRRFNEIFEIQAMKTLSSKESEELIKISIKKAREIYDILYEKHILNISSHTI